MIRFEIVYRKVDYFIKCNSGFGLDQKDQHQPGFLKLLV